MVDVRPVQRKTVPRLLRMEASIAVAEEVVVVNRNGETGLIRTAELVPETLVLEEDSLAVVATQTVSKDKVYPAALEVTDRYIAVWY